MKYYLGATDWRWYNFLSSRAPEDVNFWRPGSQTAFRALSPGDAFLFKLKKPHHAILSLPNSFFGLQAVATRPFLAGWPRSESNK